MLAIHTMPEVQFTACLRDPRKGPWLGLPWGLCRDRAGCDLRFGEPYPCPGTVKTTLSFREQ